MADNQEKKSFFNRLQNIFQQGILLRGQDHVKIRNFDIEKIQSQINLETNVDRGISSGFKKGNYMYDNLFLHGRQVTRQELYADYECISGDTIIPTPDKENNKSIKELSELYPDNKKSFYVYSYDLKTNTIKLGKAHTIKKTKTEMTYQIIFDNGETIRATENHPFLMRNGEYVQVKNLKENDLVMPFYKDLVEKFDCDEDTIKTKWQTNEINNITKTLNHKIVKIESYQIENVYDMTVDIYHNFATENCFIHNSMDQDPRLSSALDIYSDESSTKNEFGEILSIQTNNEEIKETLENLFYDILNIEFNLWPWIRILCKYGDLFIKLDITQKIGVTNAYPLSNYSVQRVEPDNKNVAFKYDPSMGFNTSAASYKTQIFKDYEIIHFRLLSDLNLIPYGKSMLENGRRTWKRLTLLEDAMLIQRIMRAPERRIVKVDVGNIPPNEIATHMNKIINNMKKIPYINEETGEYNLRFNVLNALEDYYLPVRGDTSGTDIDTLSGMEFNGMEDIEYEMQNLLASLKIPKSFLTYEDELNAKATLASEDVRFSRTIERIQRVIETELTKLALIHLFTQGYKDEDLVDFELRLTTSSKLAELERMELWNEKLSLATGMLDSGLFPLSWIYEQVLNISKDEYEKWKEEIVEDLKLFFRYQQIKDEGNDPAKTGESSGTETDEFNWKESKRKGLESEDQIDKKKRLITKTFADKIAKKQPIEDKREKTRKRRIKKEFLKRMKNTKLLSEDNILEEIN